MTYTRSTDFVIAGSSRRSYKLNEELDRIAAAFGGLDGAYDADIAAILAALALKAPLASPTFSGSPTTPTPALASNDTSIPSTAWVKSLVGSLSVGLPSQSGNSGKYLTTDGTSASWQTVAGASWGSLSGKPTTIEGFGITNAQHALEVARELERTARADDDSELLDRAVRLRDEAENTALSNRLLVLIHLKTLNTTRQQLGGWAIGQATRRNFMRSDAIVCEIVGRALEYWLDPLCPHCDGRGFSGGYGAPMVFCGGKHGCGGTGRRRVRLGKSNADHEFGRYLLAGMDRKTEAVTRQMLRFLRRPSTQGVAKSPQELHLRLAALRSSEAEKD